MAHPPRDIRVHGRNINAVQRGPTLPQELVDMIIDHLHDDKETLSSCSLTSRRWVISSQRRLLRPLRIPGRRLGQLEGRTLLSFSASLQSPSSHLSACITHLYLESLNNRLAMAIHPTSDFVSVIHRLSSLHTLILQNVDLLMSPGTDSMTNEPPVSLKRLDFRMTMIEMRDYASFNRLLDLFSIQDTFQVICSEVGEAPRTAAYEIPTKHLRIACNYWPFPNFAAATTFPRLTSLDFHLHTFWGASEDGMYLPNVGKFLRRHGSRLQQLRLDIHMMSRGGLSADEIANFPVLATVCPDLRSLQLVFTSRSAPHLDLVARMIQEMPEMLSTVILGIDSARSPLSPEGDWQLDRLVDIVDPLSKSNLTSVTFMQPRIGTHIAFDTTYEMHDFCEPLAPADQAYLVDQFPGLKARGILRFA